MSKEHILVPNGDYCLYYPSNIFFNTHLRNNSGYSSVLAAAYSVACERKHLMDYKYYTFSKMYFGYLSLELHLLVDYSWAILNALRLAVHPFVISKHPNTAIIVVIIIIIQYDNDNKVILYSAFYLKYKYPKALKIKKNCS